VTTATYVLKIVVILQLDAEMNLLLKEIWMTLTHVLKITVYLTEELFTKISLVITKINASNQNATQSKDVYSLELTVTITMHVPLINVLMEFVSTLLSHSLNLMDVLSLVATQLTDNVLPLKRIVMITMHVPQILATSTLETV